MNTSRAPFALLRVPVLALLIAVVGGTGVMAQSTVSVRGNVGASFFRSPQGLSDVLHSGTDLSLGVGTRVYRGLAVTIQGGYDQFTLDEGTARLFTRIEAGDLSFVSGALGVRYTYLNDSDAHPYVATGIGVYRLSSSNRRVFEEGNLITRQSKRTFTEMGAHFAVGSLFRLDDTFAVFFEPRYVFYNVDEKWNGTLRYFTLRLGVDVQLN